MIVAMGLGCLLGLPAWGQKFPNLPITSEQTSTAQKVAQAGVPLSELAPNAPDVYVIKVRDTLWDISKLFLKSPWRWPELWGMNLQEIKNPHLIYPGQTLYLVKRDGRAQLTGTPPAPDAVPSTGTDIPPTIPAPVVGAAPAPEGAEPGILKLGPRVRQSAPPSALPAVRLNAIESFLDEPQIVEEKEFLDSPRIVSAIENRVMIGQGDRVYARGPAHAPLQDDEAKLKQYRLFRNAKPLKNPDTGEILAYEAEYLGKATLTRGEGAIELPDGNGKTQTAQVPATIDVKSAKSEILVGDRMTLEPEREYLNFTPRAPADAVNGRIVSVYGASAVANAAQNQIVVVNLGRRDGIDNGHVLAILKDGRQFVDRTGSKPQLVKLPNERNGLLIIFRTFEKVSYGLILEINDTVRVGDRLVSPQLQ